MADRLPVMLYRRVEALVELCGEDGPEGLEVDAGETRPPEGGAEAFVRGGRARRSGGSSFLYHAAVIHGRNGAALLLATDQPTPSS